MFYDWIIDFLGSQLLGNLILLITVVVALVLGYRQIYLNDVVEIYAVTGIKEVVNIDNNVKTHLAIVNLQNIGTRLVYLDKYVFNGSEYITNGQILPPTYSQAGATYYIDLPNPKINSHVSVLVYYHDLDGRHWKSEVISDFENNIWKTSSLPRVRQPKIKY